jgi:putative holliday junction resolvase
MNTVIALDVGDKNIGIAIGNIVPPFASPHSTVLKSNGFAEKTIISLIDEHKVQLLIVGLPLNEDNSKNEQCYKIEKFCRRLQRRCNIEIRYIDEYASSEEAKELLSEVTRGKKASIKKSQSIDAIAACIILRRYLESCQSHDNNAYRNS